MGIRGRRAAATASDIVASVARDGFALVDLPAADAPAAALAAANRLDLPTDHEFVSSCRHLDRERARPVEDELRAVLEPVVAQLFPAHRMYLVGVVSKGAGVGAAVDLHQDLTSTDERVAPALMMWIPLTDEADGGGAFLVIPGSHRWTRAIRPDGVEPLPTAAHAERLLAASTELTVPIGRAVVYDPALLHGSPPNPGPARPAIAVALAPRDADLVRFVRDGDGVLHGATVDDEYFRRHGLRGDLAGQRPLRPWTRVVTEADFAPAASRGPAAAEGRGSGRTWFTTSHARRLRRLPEPGLLHDGALDARLRRDGFVWLPAHAPDAARTLSAELASVGTDADRRPIGLAPYDDPARREVDAVVGRHLDRVVAALTGQRVIRRAVVSGASAVPGGEGVDRGWQHVDERDGGRSLSFLVGVSATDVVPFGVVRHSHRLDDAARGTHLRAAWLQRTDVLRRRLLRVSLGLGDVMVLDDATVHWWSPDDTDASRSADAAVTPVAVVGTAPADAPLVHLHRTGRMAAGVSDVTEEFHLASTPAALRRRPPDPARERTIDDDAIAPDELRRSLTTTLVRLDRVNAVLAAARPRPPDPS